MPLYNLKTMFVFVFVSWLTHSILNVLFSLACICIVSLARRVRGWSLGKIGATLVLPASPILLILLAYTAKTGITSDHCSGEMSSTQTLEYFFYHMRQTGGQIPQCNHHNYQPHPALVLPCYCAQASQTITSTDPVEGFPLHPGPWELGKEGFRRQRGLNWHLHCIVFLISPQPVFAQHLYLYLYLYLYKEGKIGIFNCNLIRWYLHNTCSLLVTSFKALQRLRLRRQRRKNLHLHFLDQERAGSSNQSKFTPPNSHL